MFFFQVNKRWQPPILHDEELQNQIDKFNFDYKEITKAIAGKKTDPEESKEREEEEKEITFSTKKRGRGAPKKEARAKSVPEKKRNKPKKSIFQLYL